MVNEVAFLYNLTPKGLFFILIKGNFSLLGKLTINFISGGFFESSHDRKYLGFQLVKKILPKISANQVSFQDFVRKCVGVLWVVLYFSYGLTVLRI